MDTHHGHIVVLIAQVRQRLQLRFRQGGKRGSMTLVQ
jgi:hypothetical protein